VSIGFTWRRIAGTALAGRTPEQLRDLAPGGPADEYFRLREAGLTTGTDEEAVLIGLLLDLADGSSAGAKKFLLTPDDWDDDWLTGTVGPDTVREIAAAMSVAPWREWLTVHFDDLVAAAGEAGYGNAVEGAARDGQWARHLLLCAAELTRLFEAAAGSGESMILSMSA
jgi:hypothetical protein